MGTENAVPVRGDVSLARGEIILRAEHTKDRENRIIPISSRFRKVLAMRRGSRAGVPFPSCAYVCGDEIGQRLGNVRRAPGLRAVLLHTRHLLHPKGKKGRCRRSAAAR